MSQIKKSVLTKQGTMKQRSKQIKKYQTVFRMTQETNSPHKLKVKYQKNIPNNFKGPSAVQNIMNNLHWSALISFKDLKCSLNWIFNIKIDSGSNNFP